MVRRLWEELFKPHVDLGCFILRMGLAAIFIISGYLKLSVKGGTGWSGGYLPEGTEMAVAWGETVGGIAMVFGFLSRLAALGLAIIQVGAIEIATGRYGFHYTGYKKNAPFGGPTGAEYNFALIAICLTILVIGSGKVSLDYLLFVRKRPPTAAS